MAAAPSGVPLLVRIGVSGHRKPEDLGDCERLRTLIQEQFAELKEGLTAAGNEVEILLVSALADGADRLLVDAIWEMEPQARLIVPMPFDQSEYERTFFDSGSVDDFRTYLERPNCLEHFVVEGGSEGDFMPVGRYVVDNADVLFFLHDGSDFRQGSTDGGTASVIRYALYGRGPVTLGGRVVNHEATVGVAAAEVPASHLALCYVNTSDMTASIEWQSDSVAASAHQRSTLLLRGLEVDLAGAKDRDDLLGRIADFTSQSFDRPAAAYQRLFNRQSTLVVALAFAISVVALLDWFSGGNQVFDGLGALKRGINWDSLVVVGLVGVMLLVRSFKKRNALGRWIYLRYVAERLRPIREYLDAGIPLSTMLDKALAGLATPDLSRAWYSIYYRIHRAHRELGLPTSNAKDLRMALLSPSGFIADQIAWHRRRSADKWRQSRRGRGMRNFWYLLSLGASIAAAAAVATQIETDILSNRLDLLASLLSLLLAATATLSELKENDKIAWRYHRTADELSDVLRSIEYSSVEDDRAALANLRQLTLSAGGILMQTTFSWMDTMQAKDPSWA